MSFCWILPIFALVTLCSGNPRTPVCNVTHDSQGWHYNIIGDDNPPCFYEWLNETAHALANAREEESANVVQRHNSTSLDSKDCLPGISRKQHCDTAPYLQTVVCRVNCPKNGAPQIGTRRRIWIGVAIGLFVVVVAALCSCRNPKKSVNHWCHKTECICQNASAKMHLAKCICQDASAKIPKDVICGS